MNETPDPKNAEDVDAHEFHVREFHKFAAEQHPAWMERLKEFFTGPTVPPRWREVFTDELRQARERTTDETVVHADAMNGTLRIVFGEEGGMNPQILIAYLALSMFAGKPLFCPQLHSMNGGR